MTHKTKVRLAFAGLAMALTLAGAPGTADARGPLYGTTYPSKISGKLVSGVANILFCWCEIPIEINREIQNTDPLTGSVVGLGKGLAFTGQRLGLGAVDAITFPVDLYGNNYQSVQRTEFPFIDEVE